VGRTPWSAADALVGLFSKGRIWASMSMKSQPGGRPGVTTKSSYCLSSYFADTTLACPLKHNCMRKIRPQIRILRGVCWRQLVD
jgi:hypothetical protein